MEKPQCFGEIGRRTVKLRKRLAYYYGPTLDNLAVLFLFVGSISSRRPRGGRQRVSVGSHLSFGLTGARRGGDQNASLIIPLSIDGQTALAT